MLETTPFIRWFQHNKHHTHKNVLTWRNIYAEAIYVIVIIISAFYWPQGFKTKGDIFTFSLWVIIVFLLVWLALNNLKTMMLLDALLKPLLVIVIVYQIVVAMQPNQNVGSLVVNMIGGTLLLGGVPLVFYVFSRGKWLGFGDVKLGFIAGLLLGWSLSWFCLILQIITLTLAFLAYVLVINKVKKLSPTTHLASGIFWSSTIIISMIFGQDIINLFV